MAVPTLENFPPIAASTTVTIANNTALSGAVDLYGCTLCTVMLPATWTAASISFDVSIDGTTYGPLYTVSSALAATEYAITGPVAGAPIKVDPAIFADVRFLKVRSGTTGAPVNQGGARIITLGIRPV